MRFNLKALRGYFARSGEVDGAAASRAALLAAEGDLLHDRGDLEGAAAKYEAALSIDAACAGAHFKRGVVLQRLGRAREAIAHYEDAHRLDPASPKPLVNWGNALKDLGDLSGASAMYRRALERDHADVHALNNLATIAQERGDLGEAQALYLEAAAAKPGFVDPLFNRALIALRKGEFERGWADYELRFRTDPPVARVQAAKLDHAEVADLKAGMRVAVRSEQGVGDQILFSTLLPELFSRGVSCLVEVDRRLLSAYRRSLPGMDFVTEIGPDEEAGCDLQLALGSLPRLFRSDVEAFERQPERLLSPDPERARTYERDLADGTRVGIAWRSFQAAGRLHISDRKSAPLECFAALEARGLKLIDLQYGDVERERAAFDAAHPGLRLDVPGLDRFDDLEGVMAAIASCDLVVTTSNVTAHLAGAVGARTWLLYLDGNAPFHYWVPGADGRSRWYPNVEILADPKWTTWAAAFAGVAARLRNEAETIEASRRVRRGAALYHGGDHQAARMEFEAAVASNPRDARARFNLAVLLGEQGNAAEAIGHYRRCLEEQPGFSKAMVNLANALRELGALEEAVSLYRGAIAADPRDAHALNNLAGIELERDNAARARDLYARAADLGHLGARVGLGRALHRLGELEAAIRIHEGILASHPGNAPAHHALGLALFALERFSEAEAHYGRAASLEPGFVKAWLDRSEALRAMGRDREADEAYRRALDVPATSGNAADFSTASAAKLRAGDIASARMLADRAVAANPAFLPGRLNASLVALYEQDFERAWDDYAWRFAVPFHSGTLTPCELPEPRSADREDVRRLAIRKEQGVGDQILFSTLLPEVAARAIDAVVEIDDRLIGPYRRAFPLLEFVTSSEARGAFRGCDHQLPMGSLPRYFRRRREDFARQLPKTLAADPARVAALRGVLPVGPRIGISWRSFREGLGGLKSFDIAHFALFEGCGVRLIDLQYGDVVEERRRFDALHPGLRFEVPGLDTRDDFEGLLAAIEACDLVITCSNVTAHLAGALGKRTLLLYLRAAAPFHYWVPGPDGRSLWYPSVEVVTDPGWKTWPGIFESIACRWRSA